MAGARLEIYDSTLSTILDINDFLDIDYGETTSVFQINIYNSGSGTASTIRLYARCNSGFYTGGSESNGQEAVTNQWVNVDTGGGYTAIGGDFGNQGSASNYVALSNIAAAGSSGIINIKIAIPSDASTSGVFRVQFGVSYEGY